MKTNNNYKTFKTITWIVTILFALYFIYGIFKASKINSIYGSAVTSPAYIFGIFAFCSIIPGILWIITLVLKNNNNIKQNKKNVEQTINSANQKRIIAKQNRIIIKPQNIETEYYLSGDNKGPFKASELIQMNINRHTLVYKNGFNGWKKIEEIPELLSMLNSQIENNQS